jgi:hypothetical protein
MVAYMLMVFESKCTYFYVVELPRREIAAHILVGETDLQYMIPHLNH